MITHLTEEQLNAWLKFIIGFTFCLILILMSSLSMYSVVFVTQPMSGMAPADKQFFLLLSDMSKYILGALATLIAVKGKDQFVPPGLSTEKERIAANEPTPAPLASKRREPSINSLGDAIVITGFRGKLAPPPVDHEVRDE